MLMPEPIATHNHDSTMTKSNAITTTSRSRCSTPSSIDGGAIAAARPSKAFGERPFEAGDAVGDHGLVALKTDLHVTQSGIGQCRKPFARQQHG